MHWKIKNTFLYLFIILKITNRFENKEYFPKISGYVNMTTELWKSLRFWAEINITKNMYVYVYVPARNWSFFGLAWIVMVNAKCGRELVISQSRDYTRPGRPIYHRGSLWDPSAHTEEFCTQARATCTIWGKWMKMALKMGAFLMMIISIPSRLSNAG